MIMRCKSAHDSSLGICLLYFSNVNIKILGSMLVEVTSVNPGLRTRGDIHA